MGRVSHQVGSLAAQPNGVAMNQLTIVTRLRFAAAAAPILLVIVAAILSFAFHVFGATPRAIYENQYTAARAAEGMENALYKMDWGRAQPDGTQIVLDQQRRFIDWIETARSHIVSNEAADKIAKIAEAARPLFETMRTAAPDENTFEPRLRELEGMVADLIAADEATLTTLANSSESQARIMIGIAIAGAVVIPWLCFLAIMRITAGLEREMKQIRQLVDTLGDHGPSSEAAELDKAVTKLGFPKPNPMYAQ
jgi:hypothetical protein